jgi:galactokinase/mevalonate kinase-like predicted kinase
MEILKPKDKAEKMMKQVLALDYGAMEEFVPVERQLAKSVCKHIANEVITTIDELIELQDSVGNAVGLKHWWISVCEELDNPELLTK